MDERTQFEANLMRAQIGPSCVARVKSEWGFDAQDRVVVDLMP